MKFLSGWVIGIPLFFLKCTWRFLRWISVKMFRPMWIWLTGAIAGGIAGASIGVVTGVVGFGTGVNGFMVFGPIGFIVGLLLGLIIGVVIHNLAQRKIINDIKVSKQRATRL